MKNKSKIHYQDKDVIDKLVNIISGINMDINKITFLCIGTDRSTGDSFGPYVGTYLSEMGFANIIGTLDYPCHAVNLEEKIKLVPKDNLIIAIDACLGKIENIGHIVFKEGSIRPGAGVNKDLPEVGSYSISGIVNVGGFKEYFVLQNTRLSLVINMAKIVASAISKVFTINKEHLLSKVS